MRGVVEDLL
jgi:hypothetical protein